ncbi:MAG: hypothetical protein GIW95_02090 [Candidatus Eremiobacteraeota bacterium]|nr:hypothetical protein [Candidatus Eremiobacteraeota bacterium]
MEGTATHASARVRLIHASAGFEGVVLQERMSLSQFLLALAGALADEHPGIRRTLWGAQQRARQAPNPPDALAAWLMRHIGDAATEITVGGFGSASTDDAIVRFLQSAIERSPQGCCWTLYGENFDDLPIAAWRARRLASEPSTPSGAAVARPSSEAAAKAPGALATLFATGDRSELLTLINRYGFALIESDEAHVLYEAAMSLPEASRRTNAAVQTLLAMAAALEGQTDVAESLFLNAMAVAVDEIERSHVRLRYACDIMRRHRLDSVELLEANLALDLPGALAVASRSAVAAAYALAGRADEARTAANAALAGVTGMDDEALYARVLHQASFVALCDGRFDDAERLAAESRARAASIGLYETAGGAASVQYNVYFDVKEDLEKTVEALRFLADCGAKCGSADKQSYALTAAYEIEVERGDEAAIAALEAELQDFDVAYGLRGTDEVVLSSQALQLAWNGEFTRAYAMLKGSAERQSEPGRRARRWAEAALYAAASFNARASEHALQMAQHHIALGDPSNANRTRARGFVALTLALCGRTAEAQTEAAEAMGEMSRDRGRIYALAALSAQAAGWSSGTNAGSDVLAGLETVRTRGLGGIARLIEALPMDAFPDRTSRELVA